MDDPFRERIEFPDTLEPRGDIPRRSRSRSVISITLLGSAILFGAAAGIRIGTTHSPLEPADKIPLSRRVELLPPPSLPDAQASIADESLTKPPPVPPAKVPNLQPSGAKPVATPSHPGPKSDSDTHAPTALRHPVASSAVTHGPNPKPAQPRPSATVERDPGVPVDQVYVNKEGALVNARGEPIHGSRGDIAPPSTTAPKPGETAPTSKPIDESNP